MRICVPGLPHHVVQRGNDRQATFYRHDDYARYLDILADALQEHEVALHAYVLMTNHVHMLMTPTSPTGLSRVMQALGRKFVRYINGTYRRTGTLWEGRFKNSVVDSTSYCLACYRYIELNPVRAGISGSVADYPWSSYRANALEQSNPLLTPHPVYLGMAESPSARAAHYRKLVHERLDENLVNELRYSTAKCLPLGDDRFKAQIEKQLGRRVGSGRVGRPRKL